VDERQKQAYQDWLNGTKRADIAAKYGVAVNTVKSWITRYFKPAAGAGENKKDSKKGAPVGNTNAETHGAYTKVHLESLSESEREYIEGITLNAKENMLRELQLLFAKEGDLKKKIKAYENAEPEALYIDKVTETVIKKGAGENQAGISTAIKSTIKSSRFDRVMRLELEYNKTHGRILKLIDTIRAYETDGSRLDLDERKHVLTKQRLTGQYDIDPETGELIDTESAEDIEETEGV